jgi:hypothetical protein
MRLGRASGDLAGRVTGCSRVNQDRPEVSSPRESLFRPPREAPRLSDEGEIP